MECGKSGLNVNGCFWNRLEIKLELVFHRLKLIEKICSLILVLVNAQHFGD